MSGDTTIHPTVLLKVDDAEGTLNAVTADDGGRRALIVFRGPDDAAGYQRTSGKHTAGEGFERIGVGREAVAALLDGQGLSWVAMPGAWTGDASGGVDLFTAAGFLELLDTAERV